MTTLLNDDGCCTTRAIVDLALLHDARRAAAEASPDVRAGTFFQHVLEPFWLSDEVYDRVLGDFVFRLACSLPAGRREQLSVGPVGGTLAEWMVTWRGRRDGVQPFHHGVLVAFMDFRQPLLVLVD